VTWTMLGPPHTISFDVPKYFPIYTFNKDGTVVRNPLLDKAAGGAPQQPDSIGDQDVAKVDGGTYSGDGFWSTGSLTANIAVEYTLRFAKPGVYKFACLVHPPMVGTITITG